MLHYGDEGKIGRERRKGSTASCRGENDFSTSHQTATFDQVLFIIASVQVAGAHGRVDAWGLEEWYSNLVWRASQGKAGSDITRLLWISIQSTRLCLGDWMTNPKPSRIVMEKLPMYTSYLLFR